MGAFLYRAQKRKKQPQTCKPDSVPRAFTPLVSAIYLGPSVAGGLCAAYPPCLAVRRPLRTWARTPFPKKRCKVYVAFQPARFIPATCCQAASCALTTRFHPYPDTNVVAVIFCDTFCAPGYPGTPPVRWRGALCCPDFPPQYTRYRGGRAVCNCFFQQIFY